MRKPFRIGSGAGFSGDRLEPACILAERGGIDFLALECLGERTIALAQLRKRKNAALGYDPLLERRMELLLPLLKAHGVRLISNFGAANPLAAADAIIAIARRHRISIRIAVVTGDDVLAVVVEGLGASARRPARCQSRRWSPRGIRLSRMPVFWIPR